MTEKTTKAKIPPNSKESEMMVLGCMLTNVNSLNIAADALDESDFYYPEHKTIFQTLKTAYKNDKPADVHLIAEELKRSEKLKAIGGVNYLTALAQYAGTSAYIEEYTEIIRNKAILRRMINAAQEVEKSALEEPPDVQVSLDDAQQKFFSISQIANPSSGILIKEILSGVKAQSRIPFLKELQERQEQYQKKGPNDPGITGVPTHFMDFDKMINGLCNSNLMILAARPAMGKTALALNIAENVCFKNGLPVGIFSLEMSAEQLVHRVICSQAEVESEKIKTGSINGIEYQRIVASVNSMQKYTMIIDDQPGLKITDLRARARRMKESQKIAFLVIDYLQLISGSGYSRSMENRQNEISEISRLLKNLARELDIPILCLSQLSRKVEERAGHRPMMSDLRESGCLAGDTIIRNAETGESYTIKELAERKVQTPIPVHAVDKEYKIGQHQMVKVFYSGKKKIYELKTRTGRTIKASANHPFLKVEGWTALEKMKAGDKIGLPREINFTNGVSKINNDEIILLAHLLGDGCILPRQPYHYTSADPNNIDTVKDAAYNLFNIKSRIVKQKNWWHVYLPSPEKLTHRKHHPITNWYDKLGIERVRSYDKKIPESFLKCPNDQVALFLHHLWATDGNISVKKSAGRKPSAAIYYSSSSLDISQGVQHLLLRLGIQSTLRKVSSSNGYRQMYTVNVQSSSHQRQYLTKVGCAGQRGNIIPLLLESLDQIDENPNIDIIPKEAWSTIVKNTKDELGLGWREISAKLDTSYSGSSLFKSGLSRTRMKSLAEALSSKPLLELATSDVYWDEILSIQELGIEDVYDATVENVHNFVANDIIVHNSIEQDADIVMFLLRREYYDPYDKPGLAELIVAKNRHGGVGNVNLTFRKELAQFANYSGIRAQVSGQEDEDDAFAAFSPKSP